MSQTNSIASRLRRKGKVDPATGPNAAWLAISEANRIFGPQGWTRETLEMRNAANRERDGVMTSAYVARIRLTVLAPDGPVVRESHGCGEGRGSTPFEAHDHGIKAAELDATLRALATFGNAFGLNKITESRPKAPKQDKPPSDGKKSDPVTSSNIPESALDTGPDNSATQAPKGLKEPAPETVSKKEAGAASALMIPKLSRQRSPAHLAHVRQEPCLICGRSPVDAHHLRLSNRGPWQKRSLMSSRSHCVAVITTCFIKTQMSWSGGRRSVLTHSSSPKSSGTTVKRPKQRP